MLWTNINTDKQVMIYYRIEMIEASILLEIICLLYSLADSKLQYFFFCNLSTLRNGIHTCTHTLALTTLPSLSIEFKCQLHGTFPDAWTPVIYLPVFSSQQIISALKIFTLVCYSDLEYSSLSSSNYKCLSNNLHWSHSLLLNFILEMSYFSIPIFTRLMVVISPFLFFSQPVISRQWNGLLSFIFLLLFKCHLPIHRHFLIHFILNLPQSGKSDSKL